MHVKKNPSAPVIKNLSAKIIIFGVPELDGNSLHLRVNKRDTELLMRLFNINFWQDSHGNLHWSQSRHI